MKIKTQLELPIQEKVYAYILRKDDKGKQLLVFDHVNFPDAGTQVPGGTVEKGAWMNYCQEQFMKVLKKKSLIDSFGKM